MKRDEKLSRAEFFAHLGAGSIVSIKTLFDTLPDVALVLKDKKHRIWALNSRNVSIAGFKSEAAALGKTSYDYLPESLADIYTQHEDEVMRTHRPKLNAIAPVCDMADKLIINSLAPLYDARGKIAGTVAVYRYVAADKGDPDWYGRFQKTARYINTHYAKPIRIETLLPIAGCSRSRFGTLFARFFKMSPSEYILRTRINAAREKLDNTDELITDIAVECGFCDHSHFIKTFKRLRGMTPRKYRANRREKTNPE